jgi:protein-tyrosine-phosphatase/predicted ATP-grasp superfamily ATP-dependent carboligase
VLALGDDDRSLLATVRSLGRRGLEVHVAGCPPRCHALASRYVARVHTLPPFAGDGAEWIAALRAILTVSPFDLVVPCHDALILPLTVARAELAPLARLALLDDATLAVVNDKARSAALARAHDVPVAREVRLALGDDPERALAQLRLPLVCKPVSSFTLGRLEQKRQVRKAYSADEFRALAARMLADGELVVQENFLGTGVGVEILAEGGRILAAFQHVRVHEPLEGGGSSYRKSVALDPVLLEATRRLAAALRYTGVAMFEYKRAADGAFVFIEINGRFWGSLPLAVAAGADFPAWLYDLLVLGRRDFPSAYRVGLYGRNTLNDLDWLRANWRANRRDPTLATRPLPVVAAEVLHVLAGRERNDTLVLDDPAPGFRDVALVGGRVLAKARVALANRWWSLPVVRRLAAGAARRRLQEARAVLFVCKGNICRSPFAAALAQARWPDVTVTSAGYYPKSNRPSPEAAVAAARSFGVDLAEHRSRRLDAALVAAADAVVVFDAENATTVVQEFPDAAAKLVHLGRLDGVAEIADPYGGDDAKFRGCYARIARALDAVGRTSPITVPHTAVSISP